MTPQPEAGRCDAKTEDFTGLRAEVREARTETGRCATCGHEYYVDGDDPELSMIEYAEHQLHADRVVESLREALEATDFLLRTGNDAEEYLNPSEILSPKGSLCQQVRALLARTGDGK